MRNYKNNIAKFKRIEVIFIVLLFFVYFTPFAEAQTLSSHANISVSVTSGMSAMLIDNSINAANSSKNSGIELLISGIPGRTVVVSYESTDGHLICSGKDNNFIGYTNQDEQQNLSSAGNSGETECNIIYDNNATGKLHLNLSETSESLNIKSKDNISKDIIININY